MHPSPEANRRVASLRKAVVEPASVEPPQSMELASEEPPHGRPNGRPSVQTLAGWLAGAPGMLGLAPDACDALAGD